MVSVRTTNSLTLHHTKRFKIFYIPRPSAELIEKKKTYNFIRKKINKIVFEVDPTFSPIT